MIDISSEQIVVYAAFVIISYFIGSISPATLIGKLNGVDIRKEGSGNPGTTNVLRTLGKKAALCTLLIDVLKGFLPTLAAALLESPVCAAMCASAALLGHMFPYRYGFKGGKGVATGLGVALAIDWRVGVTAIVCAALGVLVSKRMSVGSITAAVGFAAAVYFFPVRAEEIYGKPVGMWLFIWAAVLALLVIWRHRSNIKRLAHGEEPVLSFFNKKDDMMP